MDDPDNQNKSNKRGPKHMRLRYYSSFEESIIIKLWREYFKEITSYNENLPIFRDVSYGLQKHGIRLNKQEVRRRISSYRNKYLLERSRLENDPQYVSSWHLFPLIECLFHPTTTIPEVQTESKFMEEIVLKIRQELPSLPNFNRFNWKPVKFEQNPDGCPFLEGMQPALHIKAEQLPQQQQPAQSTFSTEVKSFDGIEANPYSADPTENRPPLAAANRLENLLKCEADAFDFGNAAGGRRPRRRSIMPRTGQITRGEIERLRQENDLLAEQRDSYLADLELKEREYSMLEEVFDVWLHQQDKLMSSLDAREAIKLDEKKLH